MSSGGLRQSLTKAVLNIGICFKTFSIYILNDLTTSFLYSKPFKRLLQKGTITEVSIDILSTLTSLYDCFQQRKQKVVNDSLSNFRQLVKISLFPRGCIINY